jgi:hypothetical protein
MNIQRSLAILKTVQGSLLEGTTTPKNQAFFNRRSPSWEGDPWTKNIQKTTAGLGAGS